MLNVNWAIRFLIFVLIAQAGFSSPVLANEGDWGGDNNETSGNGNNGTKGK